jgi:hypothetical protein
VNHEIAEADALHVSTNQQTHAMHARLHKGAAWVSSGKR